MNSRRDDLARRFTSAGDLPHAGKLAKIRSLLAALVPQDREVLYRFYVLGHSGLQIDQELLLEKNQLKALRCRLRRTLLPHPRL